MTKKDQTQEEAEFKQFIANMKAALDEDIAHPENFEDEPEDLETFKHISKSLGDVDNLNRIELFQLGMEVGGLIHMMEMSNELFDAIEGEEDFDDEEGEEGDWEEVSFSEEEADEQPPKKKGGCGNCGCN